MQSNFKGVNFLNILKSYLNETGVNEVCLNGTRSLSLFSHRPISILPSPFPNELALIRLCQEFVQSQSQRLDAYSPFAGGELEGGKYRWHCMIPPACSDGAVFCLREHKFEKLNLSHFRIKKEVEETLQRICRDPTQHLLICGATGSGKTTLLSAFLKEYALDERVILIEEYPELPLISPQWIRMIARRSDIEGRGELRLTALIEESLRLRPDRIVFGEIRNLDSLVFFESVLLGHHGSLSTLHASQITGVKQRLNALLSMRRQKTGDFWSSLKALNNLWCIFLERGSPPSVVGMTNEF